MKRRLEYMGIFALLISLLGISLYFLAFPPDSGKKVDCKQAINLWDHYEGEAALAAFKGQDLKAKALKTNYEHLVMGPAHVCFPSELIDYLVQNP